MRKSASGFGAMANIAYPLEARMRKNIVSDAAEMWVMQIRTGCGHDRTRMLSVMLGEI